MALWAWSKFDVKALLIRRDSFLEQTKLEEKQQERIRQAERDGVDLFEDHENDIVTAGDCLYGVSRGANDMAESAATKAKTEEEAASQSKSARTSAAAAMKSNNS